MKKGIIGILAVILYGCFMTLSVSGETLERYRLNLAHHQVGATFLNSANMKVLLLQYQGKQIAFLLETLTGSQLQQEFPVIVQNKIDTIFVLDSDTEARVSQEKVKVLEHEFEYRDLVMEREETGVKITYQDQALCVLQYQEIDTDKCEFVYFVGANKAQEISNHVKVLIYDSGVKEDMIIKNYNNWIDTIKLAPDYYSTLIWDQETYQTVTIPRYTS